MNTRSYSDAEIEGRYVTAREVAVAAITRAIARRRQAAADHSAPRVRVEHTGFERVGGEVGSVYRVWARTGQEEFDVVDLGISRAAVRTADADLAAVLPNPSLLRYGILA